MTTGEVIKKLRNDAGLSQEQLAEIIGVSQSMVAQIERGSKNPTLSLAKVIADYFCVSVDKLAG